MKIKKLPLIAVICVLIAIVLLAGRPAPVESMPSVLTLPEDLDTYLTESEAQFDDITPGTNKVIYWADSARSKTPLSIIYLHGFSATRQETVPVSDSLAKRWGANLFYTRLSGHGRTSEAMGEITVNDWLDDTTEAFEIGKRIGERVVVIGTSTGGTLATWLALQEDTDAIESVILISPNFWPRNEMAGMLLWPYGEMLGKAVEGDYLEWEPQNELHGTYWTIRYPVGAVVEMMRLVKYVNNHDLHTIDTPVLVIYSPEDEVVSPDYITASFEEIGSDRKEIVALQDVESHNNHVIAGSILSPADNERVTNYIDAFVRGE